MGTVPLGLLKICTTTREQAAVVWMWNTENVYGHSIASLKSLSRLCRCAPTTMRSTLIDMAKKYEWFVDNGGDIRHRFTFKYDQVPEKEVVVRTPRASTTFPDWVFMVMNEWKPIGELPGPRLTHNQLKGVVEQHGEENMLEGLKKYVERKGDRTSPNVWDYAQRCVRYMGIDDDAGLPDYVKG